MSLSPGTKTREKKGSFLNFLGIGKKKHDHSAGSSASTSPAASPARSPMTLSRSSDNVPEDAVSGTTTVTTNAAGRRHTTGSPIDIPTTVKPLPTLPATHSPGIPSITVNSLALDETIVDQAPSSAEKRSTLKPAPSVDLGSSADDHSPHMRSRAGSLGANKKKSGHLPFEPLPYHESTPKLDPAQLTKLKGSGPPEILPDDIEYDDTDFIGQGSFGSVFKGRCRGQEVAVKVPRKQKLTASELTSFRNEVKIMSKIYHPNVVLFLGACVSLGKLQIVTERCMTDVEKLLAADREKKELTLLRRMQMAKDAALGMNWLHGITRIVHNDLKTPNLLVDSNLRVKVTDFGFSAVKEGDQFYDKAKKGTPLWMAPEVMMGKPYGDKADVYSFGIILWEILTRATPYPHHNDYNTFYKAVCEDHERPPIPDKTLPSIAHLIRVCWDADANVRPSFNEIIFRLNEILVDCLVDSDEGRKLWKDRFLLPKQELQEQVSWSEFETAVRAESGDEFVQLESIRPFLAIKSKDPIHQGTEYVSLERFDKVLKWFGVFWNEDYEQVMQHVFTLSRKSWFHGDITKEEAITRLAQHEEGTFLVRLSYTDPGIYPFTISMVGNQHRRVTRIYPEDESQPIVYKIGGKNTPYPTLIELIENCKDYALLKPCPKARTADGYMNYDPYAVLM